MVNIPVSEHDDFVCIILVSEQFLLEHVDLVATTCMVAHVSPLPFLPKTQDLETATPMYIVTASKASLIWQYLHQI
jgi:hypothetical protein